VIYILSKNSELIACLYIDHHHMTNMFSTDCSSDRWRKEFSRELWTRTQFGRFKFLFELRTIFFLHESGLYLSGIDSQVILHIIKAFCLFGSTVFVVISLKYFISDGKCQASFPFFQIQSFRSVATIIENFLLTT